MENSQVFIASCIVQTEKIKSICIILVRSIPFTCFNGLNVSIFVCFNAPSSAQERIIEAVFILKADWSLIECFDTCWDLIQGSVDDCLRCDCLRGQLTAMPAFLSQNSPAEPSSVPILEAGVYYLVYYKRLIDPKTMRNRSELVSILVIQFIQQFW